MRKVYAKKAPEPVGPYSQAIQHDKFTFISGQIAIDPERGEFEGGSVEEQTHKVCSNLGAVLEEAGLSSQNVVKTSCFLVNPEDFSAFNEVYSKFFTSAPARSCVFVKALPKGALVEIEAIACGD